MTSVPAGVSSTVSGLRPDPADGGNAGVELYWIPLGSGDKGRCVRTSGRFYEGLMALRERRAPLRLYHSALVVRLGGATYAIEMTPVWAASDHDRGVTSEGPVGAPILGRSRLFRYEVRCWRNGVIPDLNAAVESPRRVSSDAARARLVLDFVASFPTATWGRDEQRTGDMWNSNSLTAWLLARSGHDMEAVNAKLPAGGRAPGWSAGLIVASRPSEHETSADLPTERAAG